MFTTSTAICVAAASAPTIGFSGVAVGAVAAGMGVAALTAATGGLALAALPLLCFF